jgi:hypothetical protein
MEKDVEGALLRKELNIDRSCKHGQARLTLFIPSIDNHPSISPSNSSCSNITSRLHGIPFEFLSLIIILFIMFHLFNHLISVLTLLGYAHTTGLQIAPAAAWTAVSYVISRIPPSHHD